MQLWKISRPFLIYCPLDQNFYFELFNSFIVAIFLPTALVWRYNENLLLSESNVYVYQILFELNVTSIYQSSL